MYWHKIQKSQNYMMQGSKCQFENYLKHPCFLIKQHFTAISTVLFFFFVFFLIVITRIVITYYHYKPKLLFSFSSLFCCLSFVYPDTNFISFLVSYNPIGPDWAKALAKVLKFHGNIKMLKLGWCQVTCHHLLHVNCL